MRHNILFTFLLLLSTKSIFSQKCFTVYDSLTNKKIAYSNIWKENKIYANSDLEGKFWIRDIDLQNQFKISCIGYKTKTINISQNSVYLNVDVIALKEIVILQPLKNKKIILGSYKGNEIALTANYDLQIAEAGRAFILADSTAYFLKKIKFITIASAPNRTIGIKIYSLNNNYEPDELITTENIICEVKKGFETTVVDFSNRAIPLPKKGFFVSFQFLLIEQNKQFGERNKLWYFYEPSIGATQNVEGAIYYSMIEKNVWKKHENCQLNIQVELTD
jgi:hypothetical protein